MNKAMCLDSEYLVSTMACSFVEADTLLTSVDPGLTACMATTCSAAAGVVEELVTGTAVVGAI